MKIKTLVLLGSTIWLALAGTTSLAQSSKSGASDRYFVPSGNGLDNPDWVEEDATPPAVFSKDKLIPLEMPPQVTVKVGIDPETIVVGGDGVVRYVVVMRNASGSTSAFYEGIRCVSDEVKTYARQSGAGDWTLVKNPQWKGVTDTMPSHHAQAFARQGGCQAKLATSKQEIITVLKSGRPTSGN
jgi:hypothetical protein